MISRAGALRKIGDHLADHGDRRVGRVAHGKENFVLGIVLPAEAGEILVSAIRQPVDGLENADGRREIARRRRRMVRHAEKAPRREDRNGVERERRDCERVDRPAQCSCRAQPHQRRGHGIEPGHGHARADQRDARPARGVQLFAERTTSRRTLRQRTQAR